MVVILTCYKVQYPVSICDRTERAAFERRHILLAPIAAYSHTMTAKKLLIRPIAKRYTYKLLSDRKLFTCSTHKLVVII